MIVKYGINILLIYYKKYFADVSHRNLNAKKQIQIKLILSSYVYYWNSYFSKAPSALAYFVFLGVCETLYYV